MADTRLLISCEHGGNSIPAAYRALFTEPDVLDAHRGWDIGALQIARQMSIFFDAPLHAATVSRLLVDLNRSRRHPRLFSEFSKSLDAASRAALIEKYYLPYRQAVSDNIDTLLEQKCRVVHISVHSFTPVLGGVTRNADVGLLYDPKRPQEVSLCHDWQRALQQAAPALAVRRNYPYAGVQDGLVTALRKRCATDQYIGIELETNQRLAINGGKPWQAFREALLHSLKVTLESGYRG